MIVLRKLGLKYPKPYKEIMKDEIVDFLNSLKMKPRSLNLNRICLKRFYRWPYDLPKHQYPEQVAWIEIQKISSGITKDHLLTGNELKKLILVAAHPRDKAFISTLWETGFRIGEHLSLTVGSIQPRDYGFDLSIQASKYKTRTIPVTMSAKYLGEWLAIHPHEKDPNAPLWCRIIKPYKPLSDFGGYNIIKSCARKANIKKKVYPHLLRHTRLTNLVESEVRESHLRNIAGWEAGSPMVGIYVHLSALDTRRAMLKANGVTPEEKPEPMLKARVCSRCTLENDPTALYCGRCGTPLTTKITLATKSKEGDEIARLREEVNNLRKLIMQGTKIKVEYLQKALRKTIEEESESVLKDGKVVMTNKEFDALPEEEKNMR